MIEGRDLIPHLFRTEYSKIIAVLCKTYSLAHIELAEDVVSETFALAAETWGLKGTPDNPVGWLYTVAKNRTKHHFKRSNLFETKIRPELQNDSGEKFELDLTPENIFDSQLRMMFAICHPAIPVEAQIGLGLRILCGFGIDEIASAFLSNKETINKRLQRAKMKLKDTAHKREMLHANEVENRLSGVLRMLYLLFNEGYCSTIPNAALRKELCVEAMRLNLLLCHSPEANTPETNALMALMCFHSSRFDARLNNYGEIVLYGEQDESLWNDELIAKGEYYMNRAAQGEEISKYHLEAAIAYWHTQKEPDEDKWGNILQLYNRLLTIAYSPMAALNRTYALSKTHGSKKALSEALKLNLSTNHYYHTLLAELYKEEEPAKSTSHLEQALELASNEYDKAVILRKMGKRSRQ